jgi:hypothetical protein
LGNDVVRDTVAACVPTSWDLSSDCPAELERFGDVDTSTLLELEEPLSALARPNIALVAVLKLEFLSLTFVYFNRLEVMKEFNFLVEDLLVWVITSEKLRF